MSEQKGGKAQKRKRFLAEAGLCLNTVSTHSVFVMSRHVCETIRPKKMTEAIVSGQTMSMMSS